MAKESVRSRALREHADMLKKVGSDRAKDIGGRAANKFGRAADAALRKAQKC